MNTNQGKKTEKNNLSAFGQVEVDEIRSAFACAQVQESFVCESATIRQTQVLKVWTIPSREKKKYFSVLVMVMWQ